MLNYIKKALRITHDKLDENIINDINAARAELIRVGVKEEIAQADEPLPLVIEAIVTYCLLKYTDDEKKSAMWERAFIMQADALRKSAGYMVEREDV